MKARRVLLVLLPLAALLLSHCGVKGDPIAPDVPPPIGNGQPTVRRAYKKAKTADKQDQDDDDSDN